MTANSTFAGIYEIGSISVLQNSKAHMMGICGIMNHPSVLGLIVTALMNSGFALVKTRLEKDRRLKSQRHTRNMSLLLKELIGKVEHSAETLEERAVL